MRISMVLYIIFVIILITGCSSATIEVSKELTIDNIDSITIRNIETGQEEQIGESQYIDIVDGYNSLVDYRNDVGTTLPIRANILLKDGSIITVWGGVGDFLTIVSGEEQFNAKSEKLSSWIGEFN